MPDDLWWSDNASSNTHSRLALAQTVDILSPIVNDPFQFGQIAAANALSDVYAMGGKPWSAMNILSFPTSLSSCDFSLEIASEILNGGAQKMAEAKVVLAGGHTLEDSELKYGLSVTGFVDATSFASNAGLEEGDLIILTKPLGTGILSTAIKGNWENCQNMELELFKWASLLNYVPSQVIRALSLKAATDITGFGLAGHLMEMAEASHKHIKISAAQVPYMSQALELAEMGLLPASCHANQRYCVQEKVAISIADNVSVALSDLLFDPQTSGGIALAVSEPKVKEAQKMLTDCGHLAVIIAEVSNLAPENKAAHLVSIQ